MSTFAVVNKSSSAVAVPELPKASASARAIAGKILGRNTGATSHTTTLGKATITKQTNSLVISFAAGGILVWEMQGAGFMWTKEPASKVEMRALLNEINTRLVTDATLQSSGPVHSGRSLQWLQRVSH